MAVADIPHPVDLEVGQRLRARRIACGVTQTDLGRDLGLSAQQVQKYENGLNRISASKLFAAAQRLDTSVAWFFEGLDYGGADATRAIAASEQADYEPPPPASHEATRELIAAYKALPDDGARRSAMDYIRRLSSGAI